MRAGIMAGLLVLASCATSTDWPMLGRDATRNAVSPEENPPTDWSLTKGKERNIAWRAHLGEAALVPPVVADGLVWIGSGLSRRTKGAGVLSCFREKDGTLLWSRRFPRKDGLNQEAVWWDVSERSCPLVEGDRLWFLNSRWEVICLDIGPLKRGDGEPRELWTTDLVERTGAWPEICGMGLSQTCSIGASYRGRIYVSTGNGMNYKTSKPGRPDAPALVCLDAGTGEVLGREVSGIGGRSVIGNRSSPVTVEVVGEDGNRHGVVLFGGGDGYLYAFDPEPVLDPNRPGTRVLRERWRVDCNPAANRKPEGRPSGITGAPVVQGGRVYALLGRDFDDSSGEDGCLCCIEIATGKKRWAATGFGFSSSSPVVWEGLVFVAEVTGFVRAFDAETGAGLWTHDTLSNIAAAPLLAGALLYATTMDAEVLILDLQSGSHARERKTSSRRLSAVRPIPNSICAGPILANGTLYLAVGKELVAVRDAGKPGAPEQADPVLRGRAPDALFVPTPKDIVSRMLDLAHPGNQDLLYDLGSGDGRIVLEAAKGYHCSSVGVEIDHELVEQSRCAIQNEKLEPLAKIEHEDLLKADFSKATIVTLYVGKRLNGLLIPKLQQLKAGSRIVCHEFPLPGMTPDHELHVGSEEDGRDHALYLYTTPLKR